jgi:multiple sugar transport system substrate-binding protein
MFLEGDWNILSEVQNYPNMLGKWDVAVLPKAPNPASGDGRATISNGLCYATSAKGKNFETVKDVLRFFGSEEGQRIQGESGAAIPAYIGLEDTWVGVFDAYDYRLNVECFIDMFDYSIQSVNNKYRPSWKTQVSDNLLKIYSGQITLEEGLDSFQTAIAEAAEED